MFNKKLLLTAIVSAMIVMTACGSENTIQSASGAIESSVDSMTSSEDSQATASESAESGAASTKDNLAGNTVAASSGSLLDTSDMFTDRDLEQDPDLTDAQSITLTSGEDVTITSEGTYVISGTATDVSIIVEAADTDKVQIVLDGVNAVGLRSGTEQLLEEREFPDVGQQEAPVVAAVCAPVIIENQQRAVGFV